ncbi:hypothetical protein TomTYG75_01430 [Sphingobium sp. TomTYG75]
MKDFTAEAETLFDDSAMGELAAIIGIKDDAMLSALRADLIDLCVHFRTVIATLPCDLPGAPFNLSLTKRADWLETNVISPSERLLGAIADEMRPMFSTWPYPLSVPEFPDHASLIAELDALRSRAVDLRDSLRSQQADDAGHSQELRAELFAAVARLLRKHRPDVKPNRGVYDSDLRRRVGVYVDAMRLIFHKITGVEENLDRLIRGEINLPS